MTLLQLYDKIAAATGPSRDLDAMIFAALDNTSGMVFPDEHIKRYTGSRDVATELIARRLSGWCVLLMETPQRVVCDIHTRPLGDHTGIWPGHAEAPTAPLALLMGLLKALITINVEFETDPKAAQHG